MRVLIPFAAILALTNGAPSGVILTPLSAIAVPAVSIPAAVPTISPGDIQAAVIDATVQAEDQVRAVADQVRELTEQVIENQNEKIIEANDIAKEKTEEALWAVEEKKWQALDAVRTAEAQIDGSVASNADVIAKSTIGGVVVPTAAIAPFSASIVTPIAAPVFSPIVYASPGIIAPITKSFVTQTLTQTHPDPSKLTDADNEAASVAVKAAENEDASVAVKAAENEAASAAVKSAETADNVENNATESVQAAGDQVAVSAANIKSAESAQKVENTATAVSQVQSAIAAAPLTLVPSINLVEQWLPTSIAYIQPGLQTYSSSTIQQIQGQSPSCQ